MYVHTLDLFKKSNVKCLNGKKMLFWGRWLQHLPAGGLRNFTKLLCAMTEIWDENIANFIYPVIIQWEYLKLSLKCDAVVVDDARN